MMTDDEKMVVKIFEVAGNKLGIKVNAPFVLKVGDNIHECIAYLPEFGGKKGTLLKGTMPPDFDVDKQFITDAESQDYRWSFINVKEYSKYDESLIKECLVDWSFTGVAVDKPIWMDSIDKEEKESE